MKLYKKYVNLLDFNTFKMKFKVNICQFLHKLACIFTDGCLGVDVMIQQRVVRRR